MSSSVKDSATAQVPLERPAAPADAAALSLGDALSLELPVQIEGARREEVVGGVKVQSELFVEETRTLILFPYGVVVRSNIVLSPGHEVLLTNLKTQKQMLCHVAKVRPSTSLQGYLELAFTSPATDFWGVKFPTEASKASPPAAVPAEVPRSADIFERKTTPAPSLVDLEPGAPAPEPDRHAERTFTPAAALATNEIFPSAPAVEPSAPPAILPLSPAYPETPAPPVAADLESAEPVPAVEESDFDRAWEQSLDPDLKAIAVEPPRNPHLQAPQPLSTAAPAQQWISLDELAGEVESPAPLPLPAKENAHLPRLTVRPTPPRTPNFGSSLEGYGGESHSTSGSGTRSRRLILVGGLVAAATLLAVGTGYVLHRHRAAESTVVASSMAPPPPATLPVSSEPATNPPPSSPLDASSGASLPPASGDITLYSKPAPTAPPVPSPKPNASNPPTVRSVKPNPPLSPAPSGRGMTIPVTNPTAIPVRPSNGTSSGGAPQAPSLEGSGGSPTTLGGILPGAQQSSLPALEPPRPTGGRAVPPRALSQVAPRYPLDARQYNLEGDVVVEVEINSSGGIAGLKAVSGPLMLQQAALNAVRQWKFQPATLDDQPVAGRIRVNVRFRLK